MIRSLWRSVWNRAYRGSPTWVHDEANPLLIRILDERGAVGPGRAIDLGCGTGDNAIELARRGYEVLGVDWSERAIALARDKTDRANVTADFLVGDVTALAGTHGRFDLVVDHLVFMHMQGSRAKRAYAATLERISRPGGHALLIEGEFRQLPTRVSREWLAARLGAFILKPGDVDRYLGRSFSVEIVHRATTPVDGPRGVDEVAYWLTRKVGD